MPFTVARALLQRVISDPKNGLQARINDLLDSVDRRGDFDAGAKKLDTFVVIHEKAAGLFSLLKEAAEKYLVQEETEERRYDFLCLRLGLFSLLFYSQSFPRITQ
jgi:hypothetical protein